MNTTKFVRSAIKNVRLRLLLVKEIKMQILHVHSDFDEHELHTEVYTSLQEFIHDWVGVNYTYDELQKLDLDDEDYVSEKYCYELIRNGEHIGEWSTDEFWVVLDGKLQQGMGVLNAIR
jgi:hypothetical protein